MTRTQAEKLVERLKSACIFNRFDEPGVYMEYIRALAQYDYDRMDEAIDEIIEEDSRNVPPISCVDVSRWMGKPMSPGSFWLSVRRKTQLLLRMKRPLSCC